MIERGLLILLCVVAGCSLTDMGQRCNEANAARTRNYVIENITFRNDKDKMVFRDLSNPSCVRYVDVAKLSMGFCREEDFWQETELRRAANKTLGRAKIFSEHPSIPENNSVLPKICIEIVEQEYVTDGKKTRSTDYYALRLSVKVFPAGLTDVKECFTGEASAKAYTCWGTASSRPICAKDLYSLFSEALAEALRTAEKKEDKGQVCIASRGKCEKILF